VADGKYHEIDLGVRNLTQAIFIYVAPVGNSGEVKSIWVDRIFAAAE